MATPPAQRAPHAGTVGHDVHERERPRVVGRGIAVAEVRGPRAAVEIAGRTVAQVAVGSDMGVTEHVNRELRPPAGADLVHSRSRFDEVGVRRTARPAEHPTSEHAAEPAGGRYQAEPRVPFERHDQSAFETHRRGQRSDPSPVGGLRRGPFAAPRRQHGGQERKATAGSGRASVRRPVPGRRRVEACAWRRDGVLSRGPESVGTC